MPVKEEAKEVQGPAPPGFSPHELVGCGICWRIGLPKQFVWCCSPGRSDSSSSQESDPLEAAGSAYEKLQELQLEERREEEQQQAVAAAHLRFPL
jgi:hypothetical protein